MNNLIRINLNQTVSKTELKEKKSDISKKKPLTTKKK